MKKAIITSFYCIAILGCGTTPPRDMGPEKAASASRYTPRLSEKLDCNVALSTLYVTDYKLNDESELDSVLTEAAHWNESQKHEAANSAKGGLRAQIGKVLIGANGEYAKRQYEEILQDFAANKSASTRQRALVQLSYHTNDNPTSRKALDVWESCIRLQASSRRAVGSLLRIEKQNIDADRVEVSLSFDPYVGEEKPPILTSLIVSGGSVLPETQLAVGDFLQIDRQKKILIQRKSPKTTLYVQVRTDSLSDASLPIPPQAESPSADDLQKQLDVVSKELSDCKSGAKGCVGELATANGRIRELEQSLKTCEKERDDAVAYKNTVETYLDRPWIDHGTEAGGKAFRDKSEGALKGIFRRQEFIHDWVEIVMKPDRP